MLFGLEDASAVEALCTAMATPFEVSGAVHLQQPLAARLRHASHARTAEVRHRGPDREFLPVPCAIARPAQGGAEPFGDIHELDNDGSLAFWNELRQLSILQAERRAAVAHLDRAALRTRRRRRDHALHGLPSVLRLVGRADLGRGSRRRRRWCRRHPPRHRRHGGHATLIRAAPAVRAAIDVFQPLEPGLAEISRGIKAVFDPHDILNRGRVC